MEVPTAFSWAKEDAECIHDKKDKCFENNIIIFLKVYFKAEIIEGKWKKRMGMLKISLTQLDSKKRK